jgi:hypothetical protein
MGIDGINKPPIPPPAGPGGPAGPSPAGAGESFRVGVSEAAPIRESEALVRLERGEIGLDEYLDIRVADAVSHLHGKLGAEQLEFVKQSLRAELETDPVLIELVQRATGGGVGR